MTCRPATVDHQTTSRLGHDRRQEHTGAIEWRGTAMLPALQLCLTALEVAMLNVGGRRSSLVLT